MRNGGSAVEQHEGKASCQADDGWWSGRLHELWRLADRAQDVTELADSLYDMLLRMPGVLAVVGTRWSGGLLHYLRRVTLTEPTPSFVEFEQDFGESAAAGAPGAIRLSRFTRCRSSTAPCRMSRFWRQRACGAWHCVPCRWGKAAGRGSWSAPQTGTPSMRRYGPG